MNDKTDFTGKELIPVGAHGVEFDSVQSMYRMARLVYDSGLCPSSFTKPEQVVVAWWMALELGLRPLQALQGMAVINGRCTLNGDLALAIVEQSGELESKKVIYTGEGSTLACTVTLQRKGRSAVDYSFSVKEARDAGLFDRRSSPWSTYPKRMVYYRALGFGLRDEFSDVLKNIKTSEEAADYPGEKEAVAQMVESDLPPKAETEPVEPEVAFGYLTKIKEAVAQADAQANAGVPKAESELPETWKQSSPEAPNSPPKAKSATPMLARILALADGVKMSETELLNVIHSLRLSDKERLEEVPESVLAMLASNFETVRTVALSLWAKAQ